MNEQEITGQLVQVHGNGFTIDARTNPVRIYTNDPDVGSIPATPQKAP
ncbi:hypothetical protein ACFSC4_19235 [Deinococcus malanensis]